MTEPTLDVPQPDFSPLFSGEGEQIANRELRTLAEAYIDRFTNKPVTPELTSESGVSHGDLSPEVSREAEYMSRTPQAIILERRVNYAEYVKEVADFNSIGIGNGLIQSFGRLRLSANMSLKNARGISLEPGESVAQLHSPFYHDNIDNIVRRVLQPRRQILGLDLDPTVGVLYFSVPQVPA